MTSQRDSLPLRPGYSAAETCIPLPAGAGPPLQQHLPAARMASLYESAKRSQWNASTDIDWSLEVAYGSPLPDDSMFAMTAFYKSPLVRFGRPMWDAFRWELQSWMVSHFLHGEHAALIAAGRLVETLADVDAKFCAATQAVDEARHIEAFSRYLREKVPDPYQPSSALSSLLSSILSDSRWDVVSLGMQIVIEAVAMAAFRLADHTFHDDLIRQICRLVGRDETRHVSFGVLSLEQLYGELDRHELADREELVLESASVIRHQFLLDDIWERLGVDRAAGAEFAADNDLMIQYRRAVFARVVKSLARIGLMTERVAGGMERLQLTGFAVGRGDCAQWRRG